MSNAIKVLDEATDILAECLKYPEHLTPYIKERIDTAQELLLDWFVDLKQ